jgi:hypothetical protein
MEQMLSGCSSYVLGNLRWNTLAFSTSWNVRLSNPSLTLMIYFSVVQMRVSSGLPSIQSEHKSRKEHEHKHNILNTNPTRMAFPLNLTYGAHF